MCYTLVTYTDTLMTFTTLIKELRAIPSDLATCTVKQLRSYASLFRVPTAIRNKDALITELKFHLADFKSCLASLMPVPDSAPVEQPAPASESPVDSCVEIPGTFIDTAQFHLTEPLSVESTRNLNKLGIFPTPHKLEGVEIFCYLNNSPLAVATSHVQAVSQYLQIPNISFSRTVDKTKDIAMTDADFKSGKFFPDFKWNKRDRQWEHTDSNGVMTRVYDKTAEILRRGKDTPAWLKGKFDNHDRGVSYGVHTVRFEARHTTIDSLNSTPLHCPQESLSHKTSQTYVSAASEAVSLISLAIRSKTKRGLDDLINTYFASLHQYFSLGVSAGARFTAFKAQLKKLHNELAPEISKIRLNK